MESCPNCGFDLPPDGKCPICGYDARNAKEQSPPRKGRGAGKGAGSEGAGRQTAPAGATSSRGGTASAVQARPRRRVLPFVLGGVVIVALLVVGFVIMGTGSKPGAKLASSTAAAGASSSASGASLSSAATPSKPQASARAGQKKTQPGGSGLGSDTKTNTKAGKKASTGQPSVASGKKSGKADGDPVKDRAGKIAAKYEKSPVYQVPVGASPVGVRATHPINLFIPPHDPMYNIAKHIVDPPTSSEQSFVHWMTTHTPQKNVTFLRQKWNLAHTAINNGWLTHKRVLMGFLLTPRQWFVRRYNLPNSYEQTSLPIGYGQTITDPETVIAMTNALNPQPNQRVLEIGTGSGYQSGFLSELSNYVYTIEIVRPLGEETNQIYRLHTPQMPQYANIHRRLGDGYYGWSKYAPFDRIIVTTGIDHVPPDLLKQLKPGGMMVIPVGPPTGQTILRITKSIGPHGQIELKRRDIYRGYAKTIFVPFTASGGGTHNTGAHASSNGSSGG